ncbi:MAG: phenylacetate--CoA ligase family protein [Candidatus Heimdallarchaeota archaeon]
MTSQKILTYFINRKLRRFRRLIDKLNLSKVHREISTYSIKNIELSMRVNAINILRHSAKNSPYYREILPEYIKNLNRKNVYSIIRKLPFTTSAAVSENSKHFLAIPKSEVISVHFTYGTTGNKKTIYNSKNDLQRLKYSYALGIINCDIDSSDIAQIVYSYGVWALASHIQDALKILEIVVLPTGNYMNFEGQKKFIEEFDTTVIFGTPSYVYNLAKEIDLSEENKEKMKAIMMGGEGLPEHRRKIIEERLGGEVFLNYGLNEFGGGIGSECKAHCGYHIFPSSILEIINPQTGELVEDGEWGELVLTSLSREAMPLIRYRTGDVSRIITGKCECGVKLPRIDYIRGRADDRVIIGAAEKYYPIVFDKLFDSMKEVQDYWIEIIREDERDTMQVYILNKNGSKDLEQKVIDKLYTLDSIKVDIETTKTLNKPQIIIVDKLPNNNIKRRRLVDKRKFKP